MIWLLILYFLIGLAVFAFMSAASERRDGIPVQTSFTRWMISVLLWPVWVVILLVALAIDRSRGRTR